MFEFRNISVLAVISNSHIPEHREDDEHVSEDGGEAEAEEHAEQEDVLEAGIRKQH